MTNASATTNASDENGREGTAAKSVEAGEAGAARAVHLRFAAGYEEVPRAVAWAEPPLLLRRRDGSADLMGQASGLGGTLRYALSFGAAVEVIGPPALRRRIAREARRMAALYDADTRRCD